jgi:hypothetical protein
MPAVPGQLPIVTGETILRKNMPVWETNGLGNLNRLWWEVSGPTGGGFLTCREMFANGAKTAMESILASIRQTRWVHRAGETVFRGAEVPGGARIITVEIQVTERGGIPHMGVPMRVFG